MDFLNLNKCSKPILMIENRLNNGLNKQEVLDNLRQEIEKGRSSVASKRRIGDIINDKNALKQKKQPPK